MMSVWRKLSICVVMCVLAHVDAGAVSAQTDASGASFPSFAPVNAQVSRMVQPDGTQRVFVRDDEEPNQFHGEAPWLAEQDGRRTLVMTDPDAGGAQKGYMFLDGFLRKTLVGEKERDVQLPRHGVQGRDVKSLWPPVGRRLKSAEVPDVWSDGSRLRLWFDNPNKAGLLFAEVTLAALALFFLSRWWWWVLGGVLSIASFGCLVATSSRGGFLAFLAGLGIVFLSRIRAFLNWKRLLPVVVALSLAAGWIVWSGQSERLAKNLFREGQAETSRLLVWREVPRMIVEAPGGWGFGKSARAYIDWYQKKNNCLLQNMISGHLTFLVEAGWPLRVGYVMFWLLALILSFRQALAGKSPVPCAVLTAFAVAACFNPVVAIAELWVLPVACMVMVLNRERHAVGNWRTRLVPLLLAGVGTVVFVASVLVLKAEFEDGSRPTIRKSGDAVVLNGDEPKVWIADDDYVLHGGYWWMEGQEIRKYYQAHPDAPASAWVRSVGSLPAHADRIVLVGTAASDYLALPSRPLAREIVFLSPDCTWRAVPEEILGKAKVKLVVGNLAARLSPDYIDPPKWVEVVRGAELYVPEWYKLVF